LGSAFEMNEIELDGKTGKNINIDFGWSCEFVEHVYEKYSQNFINDLKLCKYVAITFAGPNQGGYHHVNCQPESYWIDVFENNGFLYDIEETKILREKCKDDFESMKNNPDYRDVVTPWDGTSMDKYTSHFRDRGLFFVRK
jgi:hypothetical protein